MFEAMFAQAAELRLALIHGCSMRSAVTALR